MKWSITDSGLEKILAFVLLAVGLTALPPASAEEIIIGTGGVKGVYYPLGQAICDAVNRHEDMTCRVESTGGSIYNLNALRAGRLDLGMAQSDAQYYAYNGRAVFEDQGPYQDLRAVFSVHTEALTVVARGDADIRSFDDLKGKRVNIGNPGSGQRFTMEALMAAKGWTRDDFALATELESTVQARALCDDQIDAFVFTVGHPNDSILDTASSCNAVLVEVTGPEVDELVSENPYYIKTIIAGGLYPGNPDDVQTLGVKATLVAAADTSDQAVYRVVKSVFDNFDAFRRIHPDFEDLDKEAMMTEGLTAPLHEGARRYYREAGLLHQ